MELNSIFEVMRKKNTLLIIFLFAFFVSGVKAQYKHETDSLQLELIKCKQDSSRIKINLQIGSYYESNSPDSALMFYKRALALAEKTSNKKLLITSYRYIGDVFYLQTNYPKSIESYLNSLKFSEQLLEGNTNSAEVKSIKKGISKTYANIALAYSDKGDYRKAIDYNMKSLKIKEALLPLSSGTEETESLQKGISQCYNNVGSVYYYQGLFEKSIEYYLKSLNISEKRGDKRGMSLAYNNIGSVYSDLKEYEKSIEYHSKSLKIFEEQKDIRGISGCYNNMGNNYQALKKYDKALDFYLKSLKIDKELNNQRGLSSCYTNIGQLYAEQMRFDKALENYTNSFTISDAIGDKNGASIVLVNMASLDIKLGRYKQAIENANKCLAIAKEMEALPLQVEIYNCLSEANDSLGNFKDAYHYQKLFKQINDSIFNEKSDKQIKNIEARYQNEKKQKEIELLNKDKELQKTEIKRQTTQKYAFVFGFLLMLTLAFVSYRSFRQKKKANLILAEQKHQIEEKNEELNQQNEEITAQRDEIESQRDEISAQRDTVTEQKDHIEKIHVELTDSIRYAKRIQQAVLPVNEKQRLILGEHFVLFQPRNVVSGDFYWFVKRDEFLIIAVADCTGHGVPGAFMSMLGVSFLNEIVSKSSVKTAAGVLNEMRQYVISSLQQQGVSGEQKDGMDMSVVAIDTKNLMMQFAGANNPIYIVRKSESEKLEVKNEELSTFDFKLYELKGDKMPIAIHIKMDDFSNHEIQLSRGDVLYMFSDGYADQFGGPNGRKFMYAPFKEFLLQISNKPMTEQRELLLQNFEKWRNGFKEKYEQVDDITVMGIRI